ncbi:MAG TPA: sigma-54 dependent transcriptional regulator [Terriglobia bacterium]|nr:sigma-54 dependent transcriptional regulator [Terriglobia bacterium]
MIGHDAGETDSLEGASETPVPRRNERLPLVVLAIDDDVSMLKFYASVLVNDSVRVEGAADPHRGLEMVEDLNPDLVLLDLSLPGLDGMEVLHRINDRNALARVVMVTGNYSIETAVKAIQEGAADYVCKPVSTEKLRQLVEETRRLVDLEQRAADLEEQSREVYNLEGMIGRSPVMLELFDLVRRVAPHLRTALITGETGTGKELVARALHNHSPRAQQRFAVFNCGALVEGLAESQLFGHRKGSFTGAINDQSGLFEWANGGTVFLDEIGDLALATQSKLLRVLETGELQKLGFPQPSRTDVQVIAATSRDLGADMKVGRFRADLWYRLNMVHIHLPPLRERREDILLLASHFMTKFSEQFGKDIWRASHKAQSALLAYYWPGNVRELLNAIGRAVMLTRNRVLDLEDLPDEIRMNPKSAQPLPTSLEEAERKAIVGALSVAKSKAFAARQLGISRARLYRLMEKYGLSKGSPGDPDDSSDEKQMQASEG